MTPQLTLVAPARTDEVVEPERDAEVAERERAAEVVDSDKGAEAAEPESIEDVPVTDPVEQLFDAWFRMMAAPFALFAPRQVEAARDMMHRMTRVDELL